LDAREPEGDAARIARGRLDAVECDLDDQLGTDENSDPATACLAAEQLRGLPAKELVRQALEALAHHHEAVPIRIAGAEVEVREPAAAAPVAPLRAEHDEVVRPNRLHLEPGLAAAAGGVQRRGVLDDDALVAGAERLLEDALPFGRIRRHDAGDPELRRDPRERRGPLPQ